MFIIPLFSLLTAVTALTLSQINPIQRGHNLVWGAAMSLAWENFRLSTEAGQIYLTHNHSILHQLQNFNEAPVSKHDLDKNSYCGKAGFGQKTLDQIREECDQKFPSRTIDNLPDSLPSQDFISYAYLSKNVQFETPFTKADAGVQFKDEFVKGFYADDMQKSGVEVLEYHSRDRFIVKLHLKEKNEELFVAKGYEDIPLIDLEAKGAVLEEQDVFQMPMIKLHQSKEYTEFEGKGISNAQFKGMYIEVMKEQIKFDLNEKGVKLENQALIIVVQSMPMYEEEPKEIVVDDRFWVVLREKGKNPYFIVSVDDQSWLLQVD